jgi:hypothetical protein
VHTLLFHELGHGISQSEGLALSLRALVTPDPEKINEVLRGLALPNNVPVEEIRQEVGRIIQSILLDWLEEIACDLIGYELAGPAFLFAAISFLPSLTPIDLESEDYPPVRLRLHLLFRLLDENLAVSDSNREKVYKERFPGESGELLVGWEERTRNLPAGHPLYDACIAAVTGAFEAIAAAVTDKLGRDMVFNVADHLTAIDGLVQRLALGVPPDEVDPGRPADPACILNSGWLAYFSLGPRIADYFNWELNEALLRIDDWIAKALELEEVLRRWQELAATDT